MLLLFGSGSAVKWPLACSRLWKMRVHREAERVAEALHAERKLQAHESRVAVVSVFDSGSMHVLTGLPG